MSAPTGVALLVIDVQNDILDLYGRTPWMGHVIENIADGTGDRNVDGTGRRATVCEAHNRDFAWAIGRPNRHDRSDT